MDANKIAKIIDAKCVTNNIDNQRTVEKAFASDLMSDVLTLLEDDILLITGLSNLQTIRTAEMADISMIVLARSKKSSADMIELAQKSNITILESDYSIFKICGLLYNAGLLPIF